MTTTPSPRPHGHHHNRFMSPLSPLNTPATLHAQRIASRGLEAAEALEEVDHVAAATMKAEALRDASEAYSRRRAAQR